MSKPRILFILKKQLGYNGSPVPSKGLFNSASFVVNALIAAGIDARLVEVVDANDIDREVACHRPTHCIIEALWVVPEKFAELSKLHPRVQFVVRVHSKTPFLAGEGTAIDWLRRYQVPVGFNASEAARELRGVLALPLVHLPNIYHPHSEATQKHLDQAGPNVWIGCLGAIRPLKNQLVQALAALEYAEKTRRHLIFHVNDRVEQGGEPVLRNIVALFRGTPHRLVVHPWCDRHEDVLSIVASFDLSMQVSFTETFNIVSADAAWRGVPIVASREVVWVPRTHTADPNSILEIVNRLAHVERAGIRGARKALNALRSYNTVALNAWQHFLKGENK